MNANLIAFGFGFFVIACTFMGVAWIALRHSGNYLVQRDELLTEMIQSAGAIINEEKHTVTYKQHTFPYSWVDEGDATIRFAFTITNPNRVKVWLAPMKPLPSSISKIKPKRELTNDRIFDEQVFVASEPAGIAQAIFANQPKLRTQILNIPRLCVTITDEMLQFEPNHYGDDRLLTVETWREWLDLAIECVIACQSQIQ